MSGLSAAQGVTPVAGTTTVVTGARRPGAAPHLRVPFRIVGPAALTVADGSDDEIVQNVQVVLATYRGDYLARPDLGIGDPTFGYAHESPSESEIETVIERWEPRARLTFERQAVDASGRVDLEVRVRRAR